MKKEDDEIAENVENMCDVDGEQKESLVSVGAANPKFNFDINSLTCWEWLRWVNIKKRHPITCVYS